MDDATTTTETSKQKFDHGNYKGYYKFRVDLNERMLQLRKDWFENKMCSDIGCNEGDLTFEIAKLYHPKMILGIDKDKRLIDTASSRLKREVFQYNNQMSTAKVPKKLSINSQFVPRVLKLNHSSNENIIQDKIESHYPFNIKFICKEFMGSHNNLSPSQGKYDTILCLSVIKWVHLNHGDQGLIDFLKQLYEQLKIGGRLILEFQNWKSYLNNKSVSENIKAVFPTIRIKPEQFEEILTDEIGFRLECKAGTLLHESKGFHRPIYVLIKPESDALDNKVDMDIEDSSSSIMQSVKPMASGQNPYLMHHDTMECDEMNRIPRLPLLTNHQVIRKEQQPHDIVSMNQNIGIKRKGNDR